MNLVSWCKKNQGEVPGGDSLLAFGSVSVETIQETSEIIILTDIDGRISQSISNGWPVTINGAGLQLPVLKQVHKEFSNWLYRGCLLAHLMNDTAMADLEPSMVMGCNFLSWNRYIRESATDFTGGVPRSPPDEWYITCKNGPLAS